MCLFGRKCDIINYRHYRDKIMAAAEISSDPVGTVFWIVLVGAVVAVLALSFYDEYRGKLCNILGHKIPEGWQGGLPYLKTKWYAEDGVGTEHYRVSYQCRHCDKHHTIGLIHGTKSEK